MYLGIPHWNIQELCGYEPITSFWADFSIADIYGNTAIRQTYQTAFKNWKDNYKYLTELVLVLNHKIWQWSEQNEERAKLYNDL